jgi:ABC-2 type transport system ATP-binding protein
MKVDTEAAPVAAVDIEGLVVRYGKHDAVRGLSLTVQPGRCHALFGRNGAGKTSTLQTLVNLAPVAAGRVRVFGIDPVAHEAQAKARLAYVPDAPAFYPWMTVRDALDYASSFRPAWSRDIEEHLVAKFGLDPRAPTSGLSKGQRTQLALTAAVAADPDLLVLDEPTSGLDPLVRRQFLAAVVGAFQDRNPERKALILSTHLISEFEGVVDDCTLIEEGCAVTSFNADEARGRYRRIRAWFEERVPSELPVQAVRPPRHEGRMVELIVDKESEAAGARLTAAGALRVEASALSLEEIFLTTAARPEVSP